MSRLVVVIPTLNEEIHIARAVQSAMALGHVFVVDSGSTDQTLRIALDLGAEVAEHEWEGYAAQKNWALSQIEGRFKWVLFLDADEWIPDPLVDELRAAIQSTAHGCHIPRRNIFEGRALMHAWWYPDYQLRLFRPKRGRFEDRLVHEHVVVDGPVAYLQHPLMHENLKGLGAFLDRHARYADLESREIVKARSGSAQGQRLGRLIGSWPERRRFIKTRIWYRMPFRPAIRFLWMYLVKRGFLDGRQGLVYCQLIAAYEAMIDARLLELDRAGARSVGSERPASPRPRPNLVCPVCRTPLERRSDSLTCPACAQTYPIVDGIPLLLPDVAMAEHDEIDHLSGGHDHGASGSAHKAAQAQHFDRAVAEEFETVRPHGAPRLYRFLLGEKFRRAAAPIAPHLAGATALTVCGGSGIDAEFLARAGARVVASDISLGAARRTRERARRYGLDIAPIVADIERLPFADGDFDIVLVHDGLHHLERPEAGLGEMARVARRWVSVTEPARAAATSVAVRAGVAQEREEAGNRVARLTSREVVGVLRGAGFRTLVAERYAMYYRHQPGRFFGALSRPRVFPLVRAAWRAGNALIGRAGNKLVVVAEREVE